VGVLLVIVAVATGSAYFVLARSLNAEIDSSLRSSARNIAHQIEERGVPSADPQISSSRGREDEDGDDEDDDIAYFNPAGGDIFYVVLSSSGHVLQNPLNVDPAEAVDQAAVQAALDRGEVWRTLDTEGNGTRALFLAVRHGSDAMVVEVGRSLARHDEELAELLRVLLITGGGGLLLTAAGGFLLAGHALQPTREAIERQRRFVADASHELRAPLTLIQASAEAIEGGSGEKLDEADRRSLANVLTETQHMRALVNDLLAIARFEDGRAALLLGDVDAAEMVREAAGEAHLFERDKHLVIHTESARALNAYCDQQRIAQVLRILVDNAVRHSPSNGEITLGSRYVGDWVEFWVQDAGPGIGEAHRQHVFERFYRADASRSRENGGSGLGLAIAREIVEAHGGEIEVTSGAGESGTKIAFRLPRRRGRTA
jgi:signal transduction histidine kinase